MTVDMTAEIKRLSGVGPAVAEKLKKLGIGTGTRSGFMELNAQDVTAIYTIAAHAEL